MCPPGSCPPLPHPAAGGYLLLTCALTPRRHCRLKLSLRTHAGPPGCSLLENLRLVLRQKTAAGYEKETDQRCRGTPSCALMNSGSHHAGLKTPWLGPWAEPRASGHPQINQALLGSDLPPPEPLPPNKDFKISRIKGESSFFHLIKCL